MAVREYISLIFTHIQYQWIVMPALLMQYLHDFSTARDYLLMTQTNHKVLENPTSHKNAILLSMLAQYRLNQHFDNEKQLRKVCVAVLFSNSKWSEIALWDTWCQYFVGAWDQKLQNYLTSIFYPDASKPMVDVFCSNFQGSSRICSNGSI